MIGAYGISSIGAIRSSYTSPILGQTTRRGKGGWGRRVGVTRAAGGSPGRRGVLVVEVGVSWVSSSWVMREDTPSYCGGQRSATPGSWLPPSRTPNNLRQSVT